MSSYPVEFAERIAPPVANVTIQLSPLAPPVIAGPELVIPPAPIVAPRLLLVAEVDLGSLSVLPVTVSASAPVVFDTVVDLLVADTGVAFIPGGGTATIPAGETSVAFLLQATGGAGPPVGDTTLTASTSGYDSATADVHVLCHQHSALGLFFWGTAIDGSGNLHDFGIGTGSPLGTTLNGKAAVIITVAVIGFLCPNEILTPNVTGTAPTPVQGIGGGVGTVSPSFFVTNGGMVSSGWPDSDWNNGLVQVYTMFMPGAAFGQTYNSGDTVTIEFSVDGVPFVSTTPVPNPLTFTFA